MTPFPLTDDTARLVAADWFEDRDLDAVAAVLRGLVVVEESDPVRAAWSARFDGRAPLPDVRANRAYWPERGYRPETPRLIAYRLPALVTRPAAWVAGVYARGGRTTGPESDTLAGAVCGLALCLRDAAAGLIGLPARVVPVRLASEDRPEWWDRRPS